MAPWSADAEPVDRAAVAAWHLLALAKRWMYRAAGAPKHALGPGIRDCAKPRVQLHPGLARIERVVGGQHNKTR